MAASTSKHASAAVLVAALGYFVDIYDLILFSVTRRPSLADIGVAADELQSVGTFVFNCQMVGLLVGGILWGVLGDKRGRLSVLFGSILLYSLANLANAAVHSVPLYAVLRFIAGVGLAGELGAGVTLVSELMKASHRGYGTTLIAAVGLLGAVVANQVAQFGWRSAYVVGGVMGLALFALRLRTFESGMFERVKTKEVKRGDFALLFDRRRLGIYACVILIGIPIWYVVGVLVQFSPEIGPALGLAEKPAAGTAVQWCYGGLALGGLASGLLSQAMKSRKRVVLTFHLLTIASCVAYFTLGGRSLGVFYACCGAGGFASGYWAVFVTLAAEQFGTNIRATVATTAPNFVRGLAAVQATCFDRLHAAGFTLPQAAVWTGVGSLVIAMLALVPIRETFGRDLDFVESA